MKSYKYSHVGKDVGEEYDVYLDNKFERFIFDLEKKILPRILRKYFPKKARQGLDFACGTGRITSIIQEHTVSCVGLDISADMLRSARRKYPQIKFVQADIQKKNPFKKKFDLITAWRFVLNAEDDLRKDILRRLNKMLDRDGYFIFNVHENRHSVIGFQFFLRALLGEKRIPRTMSIGDVKKLAKETGFEIVEIIPLAHVPGRLDTILMPLKLLDRVERFLSRTGIFRRFAKDLVFVCKKSRFADFDEGTYWEERIASSGMKSTGIKHSALYEYSDRLKRRLFSSQVRLPKNAKVLDVGCGFGRWSVQLAKQGHKVTATDISERAIRNARVYAKKNDVDVKFHAMPSQDLDMPKNSFDVVLSVSSLQHVVDNADWEKAISKIFSALKQGGQLVMIETAANRQKNQRLPWKGERSFAYQRKRLEELGFKLVKSRGMAFSGYYAFYACEKLVPQVFRRTLQRVLLGVLGPLDYVFSMAPGNFLYDHKLMVFER